MFKRILPIVLAVLLLTSCTVTQHFTMGSAEKGSTQSLISVDQFFLDVLDDLSDLIPSGDLSIMDETVLAFAERIQNSPFAEYGILSIDGSSTAYQLVFDYNSLSSLVKDLSESQRNSIFQIEENRISFHLDIENYGELKAFIPVLSDPNFGVYGPEYNYGTTKEEYMEMIGFLLDERGPEALEKSSVSITFRAPKAIGETVNMTKDDERSATCTFPLIDLPLLNTPIEFSFYW
ncbi:MAG: hypothetical protein KBS81_01045 [Spirochaetales bacterium]|nr:hypothetical protein [Candidatus Physcosoma equi]